MNNWIVMDDEAINCSQITHAQYREENHFGPMWVLTVFFTYGEPMSIAGAKGRHMAKMLGLLKPEETSK